ncbi:MAG: AAA family ATPase [Polyangiaceae bacterium]|nr:AAA family ATPase [Polyangiaceae bacterium]
MPRRFNTAGPCDPARHYMVPPLRRAIAMRALVDRGSNFVLHAPRQSGKTTTVMALSRALTEEGRFAALMTSVAIASPLGARVGHAERAILKIWRSKAAGQLPPDLQPPPATAAPAGSRIHTALSEWAAACPRPLALFLDEIDALQDDVLLSILRQLHAGYPDRPARFPSSIALIGLRDVRDYKVSDSEERRLGTASPFNIKDRSLTLPSFTRDEVAELLGQHTAETGQVFEPAVIERIHTLTGGHPWLVNALAQEMVEVLVPDPASPVTLAHVEPARDNVIARRDTHFDSLAERLREERVRKMIEPILQGSALPDVAEDDFSYVLDLGLVRRAPTDTLEIANPIYAEVIPRLLTRGIRASMGMIRPTWLLPDGRLDPARLLDAFLAFWRRHGEALMGASPYHESAPHLVMMAFLQRVENGGGTLHREFAIGSGRLDLLLEYKDVKVPMELKVWRPGQPDPVKDGLEQVDEYLAGLGEPTGWLVIFDRRPKARKADRNAEAKLRKTPAGRRVTVIRA